MAVSGSLVLSDLEVSLRIVGKWFSKVVLVGDCRYGHVCAYCCQLRVEVCLFWSIICRALFPRMFHTLCSRISSFSEYSVAFDDVDGNQQCVVGTWKDIGLLEVCVHVELAAQLRVVSVSATSQFPMLFLGGNPTLMRVISDNRGDERHFFVNSSLPKSSYHAITKLAKSS